MYLVYFFCQQFRLPFSLPSPPPPPQVYRIKDNVTYSVVLEEFDAEEGGWRPYTADDVQVYTVIIILIVNCQHEY